MSDRSQALDDARSRRYFQRDVVSARRTAIAEWDPKVCEMLKHAVEDTWENEKKSILIVRPKPGYRPNDRLERHFHGGEKYRWEYDRLRWFGGIRCYERTSDGKRHQYWRGYLVTLLIDPLTGHSKWGFEIECAHRYRNVAMLSTPILAGSTVFGLIEGLVEAIHYGPMTI